MEEYEDEIYAGIMKGGFDSQGESGTSSLDNNPPALKRFSPRARSAVGRLVIAEHLSNQDLRVSYGRIVGAGVPHRQQLVVVTACIPTQSSRPYKGAPYSVC